MSGDFDVTSRMPENIGPTTRHIAKKPPRKDRVSIRAVAKRLSHVSSKTENELTASGFLGLSYQSP